MKLNWNFLRGWGVQNEKSSVGGVWIFSGTAHSTCLYVMIDSMLVPEVPLLLINKQSICQNF